MKKVILFAILLFVSKEYGFCEEVYKPLLTDEKSWKVVTTNTCPIDHNEKVSCIEILGDTIVNGHVCKVLVHYNDEYTNKTVLMEEDKIIYHYDESTKTFLPMMNFNLHEGDQVGDWGRVLCEDYVDVNNINYRRLAIGYEEQKPLAYWVEGIGASKDYWITPFDKHIGDYSYMSECGENGKVVFTQDDFCKSEEHPYMPVLAEGRLWKLSYTYRDTWQDIPDAYMTIAVAGDSIVDGKKCKKLLVDYRNLTEVVYPRYIVAYETGGRVYRIDGDREEHLVMNINLHQGDAVDIVQTVQKEDTVIVDGIKRKRLIIDSGVDHCDGEYLYYLVEGIGMSKDEFVNLGLIDENIYFHRLIACYDNGKCVFSAADFLKEGTSGLNMPKVNCPKNDQIYDLQGRKRGSIRKGEIFIRNGKKHINR